MDAEVVLTDETFTTDSYVKMVSNNWKANGGYDRFTITDRIITFKTDAFGQEYAVVNCKWSYRFTGDDYYFAIGNDVTMTLMKVSGKWYIWYIG